MTQWTIPLDQFAEKAMVNLETVVRKSTLELFRNVVLRSPVGNPELWAANAHAAYGRATHNLFVDQFNATLQSGEKKARRLGQKTLKTTYPLKSGKGYVGGRFRANWNVTYGAPDVSTTESTDKNRGLTEAGKVLTLPVGGVMYLTNGLPYAHRLEFEAWSKQAPAGMVRIEKMLFGDYVQKAIK